MGEVEFIDPSTEQPAQDPPKKRDITTITGTVVTAAGQAVPDVEVRCFIYDDLFTVRTNGAGEFTFDVPDYAKYREFENDVELPLLSDAGKGGVLAVTVSSDTLETSQTRLSRPGSTAASCRS